jgi:fibronectin-binding autotransporter adhesin
MKLFLKSILFFAIASFAPQAFGQEPIAWTNMGPDNTFDNGANWTLATGTGTVPGSTNDAYIFPGFAAQADPTTLLISVLQGGLRTITINTVNNQSVQGLAISSNFEVATITNGVLNLNFNSGSSLTVGTDGAVITGASTVNFTGNLQILSGTLLVGSTTSIIDPSQITGSGTLNLGAGTVNLDSATTSFIVGQGTTGAVTQNTGSIVTAGQTLIIGSGGTGTYTVNASATLNIGTTGTPQSNFYLVKIGTGSGSVGTLNISGGTLNALNPSSTFQVGGSGTGTIQQNGAVNLGGAISSLLVGENGNYELMSGALEIGENNIDTVTVDLDGTGPVGGTLTQSGGTLTAGAATTVIIGDAGIGNYNLSGGPSVTADFQNGFTVGNQGGSTGTVTQTGGTLSAENNVVTIGGGGTGIYNMEGGTATFNSGVVVGATGTVNQTGGTFVIPTGQTLDLSTVGSSYTLGGTGILQVTNGGLVGTSGEGTLNFAGGTLQVTSAGTFTDPLDGTLTGVSTIDAVTTPGVTSVTMAGNLSGSGGITFEGTAGTTTFQFAGTNTYTGPTTIASGTLDAPAADITNSSALNIRSTGVLNLTLASGGFAYAGALGGSGALNIIFNTAGNPFVVLNTSSYTGPITLGAGSSPTRGTLQVYSGTYGNISDNGTGSGVTIGGTPLVAFPGGTVIPATGIVTFGSTTYTGLTTINSGFTLNANNLDGAVTNIGSLYTLGAGSVDNTGTLGLLQSSAIGSTLNINGSLNSAAPTSVLNIRVNGTTSDSIVANTATLAGVINVTGRGNNTYTIVTAAGGITIGGDGNVNDVAGLIASTGSSVLFGAILVPDPFTGGGTTLQLTTTQRTFQQAASLGLIPNLTPNETAVTGALDPVIANGAPYPTALAPILAAFNQLSASQIPGALDELSPESLQYARMIAFENSTYLVERMDGICADLRGGYRGLDTSAINVVAPGFESGLGHSLGSLLAYNDPSFHPVAPNGVNYYPGEEGGPSSSSSSTSSTPTWDSSTQVISDSPNPYLAKANPAGPETPGFSEFVAGDVILADLNQNQNAANAPSSKASYTAGGATAGISFRMNSHLAAGVLFDYNHTDAKTDSNGSKIDVDSYSPGLFATYFDHGFYANGLFSFGYNTYSNSRDISVLGETASSHPSGEQYVPNLDLGYDFYPNNNWVLGPTVGVTYTHLDIDHFSETGAPGANLNVDNQSADSLRSRLGGHVTFQTNTGDVLLQPSLTAMWQHEYMDNGSGITSTFGDFNSNPFTIETLSPSRDSALIGCGLTATLNNSLALYFNYLADVGANDYFAQSVVGGVKARF